MIINTGPYQFNIKYLPHYAQRELCSIYETELEYSSSTPCDFTLVAETTGLLRRFIRRQKIFTLDGQRIFNPISYDKCLPSVEWAMNWCIASYDHNHLLLHAAVIEKQGKAVILPASQGSGKSTLSAYLGLNGWHLYSDEFAIIDLKTGCVRPMFRPASLKNASIDVIKQQVPDALFSLTTTGTQKGAIAHVKTLTQQEFSQLKPVKIVSVVTPKYRNNTPLEKSALNKTQSMALMIRNAFNYNVLGLPAFEVLSDIASNSDALAITYSTFSDVVPILDELVQ